MSNNNVRLPIYRERKNSNIHSNKRKRSRPRIKYTYIISNSISSRIDRLDIERSRRHIINESIHTVVATN